MAKKKLYDVVAANNGTAATAAGINWPEGQARASVNNSARAQMAVEKAHLLDNEALTTAGTSTAYTVTTNQSMATPEDGDTISVRWDETCGATPTLAVDGGTARTIVHDDGVAVAAGDFVANGIAKLTYRLANTTWYAIGGLARAARGPASSVDNAAARYDSTTGKIIQDSALIIADTTGSLSRSGNGGIPVQGTNTNDSAAAGYVGEVISSSVAVGSAVSLTTSTSANVTSISLTAGDWDVWGNVWFNPAGTTTIAAVQGAISTTSATMPTAPGNGADTILQASFATGAAQGIPVGQRTISLSGTTTVYLVALSSFGVSTMGAYGSIYARRVR